jgi:hypothetical protein
MRKMKTINNKTNVAFGRGILFMLTMLLTASVYADKTNAAMESFFIRGKVVQVMDAGILIDGSCFRSEDWQHLGALIQKSKAMDKKAESMPDSEAKIEANQKFMLFTVHVIKLREKMETKGMYFVTGITNSLADGEKWNGTVCYADLYSYISVSGAKKTVRHYSTSFVGNYD